MHTVEHSSGPQRPDHAPATAGRLPGILLVLAAIAGLLLANILPIGSVAQFWHVSWLIRPDCRLPSLLEIVNDGLMALFFLVAGLEIKLELCCGSLRGIRRAALPVVAALGGVLLPALIYRGFNVGLPQGSGWAVPTATDIAFATGVLALLGPALAGRLRPLLLALAMIDDVIAVVVVLVFYSQDVVLAGWGWLLAACGGYLWLRLRGVANTPGLLLIGVLIWLGLWQCGLHPALAGMLLGLLWPPGRTQPWRGANRLKSRLEPWVAYVVMPGFALINASVDLHGLNLASPTAVRLILGVVCGLVLGKPAGIVLASWLATRLGLAWLPLGITWPEMGLIGVLAGIGLTMAMFISGMALHSTAEQSLARVAVLLASLLAALMAMLVGWMLSRRQLPKAGDASAGDAAR